MDNAIIDWNKIKNEYAVTNISTRDLAAKYGVPYGTLSKRAMREKWVQARERLLPSVEAGRQQAVAEAEAEAIQKVSYEEYKGILAAAGLLSEKIVEAVQMMSAEDVLKDKRGLRSLTGAIKDLTEIQGLMPTGADRQLPEAITVVIDGADDYCEV